VGFERQYIYDDKCYELAQHFLPEGTEEQLDCLANEIQTTIEDWLEDKELN
jgi:hypothetical protein